VGESYDTPEGPGDSAKLTGEKNWKHGNMGDRRNDKQAWMMGGTKSSIKKKTTKVTSECFEKGRKTMTSKDRTGPHLKRNKTRTREVRIGTRKGV